MTTEHAPEWRSFPPFYAHLGLELQSLGDGACAARLPSQPHFCNSYGSLHGGILASVLDVVLSQAVLSTLEKSATASTISLTVNYLAPAKGDVVGTGSVVKSGKTIAFARAEVTDSTGGVVCSATAAFRVAIPR